MNTASLPDTSTSLPPVKRSWVVVLVVAGGLLLPGAARADPPPCTQSPGAPGTQTVNFSYTGGAQCWAIPADVITATFDVYGAQGASNFAHTAQGGKGAHARTTVQVTPASNLQIDVGGQGPGAGNEAGGFNGGGGSGRTGGTENLSGGGGGASDVRNGGAGAAGLAGADAAGAAAGIGAAAGACGVAWR
jgi:Glycine rich protein